MKRTGRRSDCPVNFAVQTFGDGWSLLVIRDLMFTDRATYTGFLAAEERIATNVLADRLRHLQKAGLIRQRTSGGVAGYGLTEKGLDLLPMMLEMIRWSASFDDRTAAPPGFVNRIRKDREQLTAELQQELRRRHGLSENPPARRRSR
ncbi:MAG TPA: helix-turn-helix domain-containing protein [Gemmatimonadales bacterium]